MKKFATNILIFILIIITIASILDCIISNGLKKTEKGHFYTFNKIMNNVINADVLIMGNSRGACQYSPVIIDSILNVNSLNISVSGQPFGVSYLRYNLYRDNNIAPKLIILNADYAELRMYNNGFEREQYYPYIKDKRLDSVIKNNGLTFPDKHIPLYRYRGNYKLMLSGILEYFSLKHIQDNYYKGYLNNNKCWDANTFRNLIKGGGKIKIAYDSVAISKLDSFLYNANRDSIKVILCYSPIHSELNNHLETNDSIIQIYKALANKHNQTYLDYTDLEICNDSSYFMDTNHLNQDGAVIFSKKLATDLKELRLIEH